MSAKIVPHRNVQRALDDCTYYQATCYRTCGATIIQEAPATRKLMLNKLEPMGLGTGSKW